MSDTKHTQGPWRTLWGQDTMAVETADDRIVASADFDDDDDGIPYDECKANANLIAAAPDLLEACEWMLEHCDQGGVVGKEPCDNARAAIAKARGETHAS